MKKFLLSFDPLLGFTIIITLPIFSTLRIVNLGDIIIEINIIKVVILTIIIITLTIAINHEEESIIFVAEKVSTLASIQMMSNGRQKNFGDETENFVEIRANTMDF